MWNFYSENIKSLNRPLNTKTKTNKLRRAFKHKWPKTIYDWPYMRARVCICMCLWNNINFTWISTSLHNQWLVSFSEPLICIGYYSIMGKQLIIPFWLNSKNHSNSHRYIKYTCATSRLFDRPTDRPIVRPSVRPTVHPPALILSLQRIYSVCSKVSNLFFFLSLPRDRGSSTIATKSTAAQLPHHNYLLNKLALYMIYINIYKHTPFFRFQWSLLLRASLYVFMCICVTHTYAHTHILQINRRFHWNNNTHVCTDGFWVQCLT